MAITGSGEIKLRADVNNEIEGNNTDTDVSLRTLSASAGESVPDALSEFYGYTSAEGVDDGEMKWLVVAGGSGGGSNGGGGGAGGLRTSWGDTSGGGDRKSVV